MKHQVVFWIARCTLSGRMARFFSANFVHVDRVIRVIRPNTRSQVPRRRVAVRLIIAIIASAILCHASDVARADNGQTVENPERPVDFNNQIRPILTQYCSSCHGGVKQAGDLSFVYAEQVLPPDGWVIEPGDPEASILIERIRSSDPDERMPPPDEHPDPLSAKEIALLEKWIAEGAKWGRLWSMEPLATEAAPQSSEASKWARQPLD